MAEAKSGFAGQGGSFSAGTFSSAGGAVADIFGGYAKEKSLRLQAYGNKAEAFNYYKAADLADRNAQFSEMSTKIKTTQSDRQTYKVIGGQQADVAGAGFAASGSALDLLRDSSAQGALNTATLGFQGLMEQDAYHEQADSFRRMSAAASYAAGVQDHEAGKAVTQGWITGGIKAAGAFASLA